MTLQLICIVAVLVMVDQCGSITLSCTTTKPKDQGTLSCTCTNPTKNGVDWSKDTSLTTSCLGASDNCLPLVPDYTTDVSKDEFYLQISSYSSTDCATYTCKDATTLDEDSVTSLIAAFDNSTITTTEPGAKTDGSISITTDCVFSPSDLEIRWYKLQGSAQLDFTDPVLSNDRSTCTRTCNSLEDQKVTSGFTHTEYFGSNAVEVQFMVTVSHSSYSEQFTWTSATYKIEGDCTCECKCKCRRIVIASIVIGIIGAIILPIVIGGTVKGFFDKEIALAVDILGFVCGVISFALGIVVQHEDCCKNDPDCCENSDCCQDECKKNWIEHTALGFIIFGCLVGIVAGVIFFLVWSGKIRRGRNGITKQDLRPLEETVCKKLLRVLESAYPKILLVKDLIRKVDAEETVVMEQLEELKRKDLIRQLDSGGFVRHFLDVKTGITKQDLRPLEEIVCEKLLRVLESVYPNILSVKDLIRIDFAEESVVMEQLEELRRKDLIKQLDSGGFVRHFLDVKTAYKAKEAKEPGENDRLMETSN